MDLEAIKRRRGAVMQHGPWAWDRYHDGATFALVEGRQSILCHTVHVNDASVLVPALHVDPAVADFILHSPQDISDLIAEVERLRERAAGRKPLDSREDAGVTT